LQQHQYSLPVAALQGSQLVDYFELVLCPRRTSLTQSLDIISFEYSSHFFQST